jgi:hypothetical protein
LARSSCAWSDFCTVLFSIYNWTAGIKNERGKVMSWECPECGNNNKDY